MYWILYQLLVNFRVCNFFIFRVRNLFQANEKSSCKLKFHTLLENKQMKVVKPCMCVSILTWNIYWYISCQYVKHNNYVNIWAKYKNLMFLSNKCCHFHDIAMYIRMLWIKWNFLVSTIAFFRCFKAPLTAVQLVYRCQTTLQLKLLENYGPFHWICLAGCKRLPSSLKTDRCF